MAGHDGYLQVSAPITVTGTPALILPSSRSGILIWAVNWMTKATGTFTLKITNSGAVAVALNWEAQVASATIPPLNKSIAFPLGLFSKTNPVVTLSAAGTIHIYYTIS